MSTITAVKAMEVLDSRGNPTVRVTVESGDNQGTFTVPSGASTGAHEAVERRDGTKRYGGKGVYNAVNAVEEDLAPVVLGRDVFAQREIDAILVDQDGTDNLRQIGANAVLGVSGAVICAASSVANVPLYEYLSDDKERIPMPMINILSGGLHAQGGIEIQDFLIIPIGCKEYTSALETAWDVRQSVREQIVKDGNRPLLADEGGFAPPFESISGAFELLLDGIEAAGYIPGSDVALALDVAATHFYDENTQQYKLESVEKTLSGKEMANQVMQWVSEYPIVSIEDPLAEDDWKQWQFLLSNLDDSVQLLGDDLLATDKSRLNRASATGAANAVLIKPNQTGTITQAIEAIEYAQNSEMNTVVSARSGETCDSTIADLATGLNTDQIKIGSLARSERLAKYNRLLEIDTNNDLDFSLFNRSKNNIQCRK